MAATALDAGVLIGFLDSLDAHHQGAIKALTRLAEHGESLVVSAVTLSEVFVGPQRLGGDKFLAAREKVYGLPLMVVVPLDSELAEGTAAMRVEHRRLQTPDAAVVATARAVGAERILTTDDDFKHIEEAITLRQFNRSN